MNGYLCWFAKLCLPSLELEELTRKGLHKWVLTYIYSKMWEIVLCIELDRPGRPRDATVENFLGWVSDWKDSIIRNSWRSALFYRCCHWVHASCPTSEAWLTLDHDNYLWWHTSSAGTLSIFIDNCKCLLSTRWSVVAKAYSNVTGNSRQCKSFQRRSRSQRGLVPSLPSVLNVDLRRQSLDNSQRSVLLACDSR